MLSPCTCFPFFTVVSPLIRRPIELQDIHHLVVPIICQRVGSQLPKNDFLHKEGPGGRRPEVGCGRDGRRRMTALVNSRAAVRLLGSASLRGDAVGRHGASSHADLFWARRRGPSGLLWPLSPPTGRPRVSSAYIAVPDDYSAHARRKTSRPRVHPPSAAGGRRSLCFAQLRRRVRQQHTSRNCQEWCVSQTFLTGQSLHGAL
jgi:hypothetical protein